MTPARHWAGERRQAARPEARRPARRLRLPGRHVQGAARGEPGVVSDILETLRVVCAARRSLMCRAGLSDATPVTRGDDFAALRDLIADGLAGVGADEDGF